MRTLTKTDFMVPVMLLALSAVPFVGGIVRLISLSSAVTVEEARFHAAPLPVVLHVVGAALFSLLGAFQFSAGFRRRWPGWHRRAGKLLAVCGLSTALTGIWMTASYRIPEGLQGPILYAVRIMVGVAMSVAIVVAWSCIRRREVARHEAWMIRAYALGQGTGTQAALLLPWCSLRTRHWLDAGPADDPGLGDKCSLRRVDHSASNERCGIPRLL